MSPEEEDNVLAAEYVLGLLTRTETQAFEQRLSVDPGFRALYARWADHFVAMFENVAPVAPPARVKAAIDGKLFGTEGRSFWTRLGLFPALFGAALAGVVILAIVNLDLLVPQGPQGPVYAARMATEDADLVLLASYDAGSGTLTVDRTVGSVAEGRAQELWVIPPGEGAAPISLGLLSEDEVTTLTPPADLADAISRGTLAISDEAPGGSTSGAPNVVLAAGAVTEA